MWTVVYDDTIEKILCVVGSEPVLPALGRTGYSRLALNYGGLDSTVESAAKILGRIRSILLVRLEDRSCQ